MQMESHDERARQLELDKEFWRSQISTIKFKDEIDTSLYSFRYSVVTDGICSIPFKTLAAAIARLAGIDHGFVMTDFGPVVLAKLNKDIREINISIEQHLRSYTGRLAGGDSKCHIKQPGKFKHGETKRNKDGDIQE